MIMLDCKDIGPCLHSPDPRPRDFCIMHLELQECKADVLPVS